MLSPIADDIAKMDMDNKIMQLNHSHISPPPHPIFQYYHYTSILGKAAGIAREEKCKFGYALAETGRKDGSIEKTVTMGNIGRRGRYANPTSSTPP